MARARTVGRRRHWALIAGLALGAPAASAAQDGPAAGASGEGDPDARFERLDRDGDGYLDAGELPDPRLLRRLDRDGDGRISPAEAEAAAAAADGRRGARRGGAAARPEVGRVLRDVPTRPDLGRAGRACALDLYLPPDEVPAPGARGARRPIVVMVHGGGWRAGDKALEAVVWPKATWFLQRGCAFASVGYRLAPAATPREQARDVAAAVALLRGRGAELGLDPERVVLIGHSAGAHLAALAVTDPTAFGAPAGGAPAGGAPVCAVVCLDTAAYDVPRLLAEVPARRATLEPVFGRDPEAQRLASPRAHVSPDRAVPPALLVWTGERADARAASEDFAAALVAAGHRAEVWNAAHTDHGGVNRGLGAPGDPTTRAVARFLAQHVPGLVTGDAAGDVPPPPAPDGGR